MRLSLIGNEITVYLGQFNFKGKKRDMLEEGNADRRDGRISWNTYLISLKKSSFMF